MIFTVHKEFRGGYFCQPMVERAYLKIASVVWSRVTCQHCLKRRRKFGKTPRSKV